MNFEETIVRNIKQKILQDTNKLEFGMAYFKTDKKFPEEVINKIWDSIDWEDVIETIKPEIHKRICNTVIASIETELKTDVKKVLSIKSVREQLRYEIYPKIMKILDGGD